MGLDMELYAVELDSRKTLSVYWRKSNAIHNWFVQNVQNGDDDCRSYMVTRSMLQELKKDCKEVLADKSKASDILPTYAGSFFGSGLYDDDYFLDLEFTVKEIDKLLEKQEKSLCETIFIYTSSW